MQRPVLTVIACPNGSGKSTLIEYMMRQGVDFGTYINADDIARQENLTGDTGALQAQQLANEARNECLRAGRSFSFETVMSHESKVLFMETAKAAGFQTQLFFVATGNPVVNICRVRTRVAAGGHDVPEDRIVSRYYRTLELLPRALLASDWAVVFDNSLASDASASLRLRPVMETTFALGVLKLIPLSPVPSWTIEALKFASLGYVPEELSQSFKPAGDVEQATRTGLIDGLLKHKLRQVIGFGEVGESIELCFREPPNRQYH